jgi:UDP-2-acetamido-3-amino-2,3-dideoxy-glucuronate N-acetyltransferase
MFNPIPPRIACIGAGYWGQNLVRNFHQLGALRWVCDGDGEQVARLRMKYPDAMFSGQHSEVLGDRDISAVAIATPAVSHGALVREALLAGKHVFVEKPLCLSLPEARQLIDLAAERKLVLMVGHLLWYHPAVLKLKQLIDDGVLGRIRYIYSCRLNLGKIRREENILWSFAPHDISVILGLTGEMPDNVSAQGGNYLHDRIADVTVTLLSFPSGTRAHVFVSWLHPFKEQKLVVVGDRQMAVFDDMEPVDKLVLYPHSIEWKGRMPVPNKANPSPVALDRNEPLAEECLHFLDAIATGAKPRTDGAEGLRVLEVLQRCERALQPDPGAFDANRNGNSSTVQAAMPYRVHPSAFIDSNVEIGAGTTIWHVSHVLPNSRIGDHCRIGQNVVIGPNATIGNNVKIQNNVSVYEGVTLEDNVFCGPSMVFTNVYNPRSEIRRMHELRRTLVRHGATLGANCTIVCGVTIGRYAFVGAGAVVTRDVPDHALVVGNPARLVGWMCACGQRLDLDGDGGFCRECRRSYRQSGNRFLPLEI